MLLGIRARPLGMNSPWYVGAGLTTIDLRDDSYTDPLFRTTSSHDYSLLLMGVRLPIPWARPLVELQVLDPLHPDRAQFHVYTGATVQVR